MRRTGVALLALFLASCASGPTSTVQPTATRSRLEAANRAALAVLGPWRHAGEARFDTLLTDDFQFVFVAADSAGNDRPWLREDELASEYHMFVGGGPHPPVSHFQLTFVGTPIALPDPRPGKDPGWHRLVRTRVQLTMREDWDGTTSERLVCGDAAFYLVRGDSAGIPADLQQQGWRPDSTRWWIQRWDDGTLPAGAVAAAATSAVRRTSWGQLKLDYR